MASNVASKNVSSKWNTLYGEAKLYFSRHPIICAYIIMGTVFSVEWLRKYYQVDPLFACVPKYRRYNIVVRPDDPAAKLVKRHEIGLDRI